MNAITWNKVVAGHYISSEGDNVRKVGKAWHWMGAGAFEGTTIDTFPTLTAAQEHIARIDAELQATAPVEPVLMACCGKRYADVPASMGHECAEQTLTETPQGARMSLTGRRAHRTHRKTDRKAQRAARRRNRI
jgi:hypothetical protein